MSQLEGITTNYNKLVVLTAPYLQTLLNSINGFIVAQSRQFIARDPTPEERQDLRSAHEMADHIRLITKTITNERYVVDDVLKDLCAKFPVFKSIQGTTG